MSDTELAEDVATLAANVRWCCSVMTKPDITQAQWRDFLNAVDVLARRASSPAPSATRKVAENVIGKRVIDDLQRSPRAPADRSRE